MDYLKSANEMFRNDLYATKLSGIKIMQVEPEYAKCEMEITPDHLNAGGVVMGGAIYTLADFTFAVAANAGSPVTVTLGSSIDFVSPSKAERLYAEAKCIKNGKSVCFYSVTVFEQSGRIIAFATSKGFRKS